MAQVRSRPKKGPLKLVASVADGMLNDPSANVAPVNSLHQSATLHPQES